MAQTTDINGIPWPELGDEPNIENAVKPAVEHIDTRIIPRFSTTTERDSAITVPVDGMTCYVATHGLMTYRSGWKPKAGVQIARLVQQAAQSIPTGVTGTAITFAAGSQDYLPYGGHNTGTNNTRLVLPFPGRFDIRGTVGYSGTIAGIQMAAIAKNGVANVVTGSAMNRTSTSTTNPSFGAACTVSANGTTDYVELVCYHGTGSSVNTLVSGAAATFLEAFYCGPSL